MKKYTEKDHMFAVCAYKESPFLEDCIGSLLKQKIRSGIIITTSTPNSHICAIADKYHLQIKVNRGENGIAGDWNFAYRAAKKSLVTLAHQDDVYDPGYTEKILEALNRCRRPLIAFSDYYELRGSQTIRKNKLLTVKRILLFPLKCKILWSSRFVRRRILSLGSAICCPAVTMVKDNLPDPLFKNNMKSNIDWQAWETISKRKGEFAYVSQGLMKHRIHTGSTTSELLELNKRREEDLLMYEKFWPKWVARCIEHFYQSSEKSNQS